MKRIAKYLLYIMITIILILFPFLIEKHNKNLIIR